MLQIGSCSPTFGSSSVIPSHIQLVLMALEWLDGIIQLQGFHPSPQPLPHHPYPLVALNGCLCYLCPVGFPWSHLRLVGYIPLSLLCFPVCILLECPLLLLLYMFLPHFMYLRLPNCCLDSPLLGFWCPSCLFPLLVFLIPFLLLGFIFPLLRRWRPWRCCQRPQWGCYMDLQR